MTTIELRQLALADLKRIEEIERRSYPTPWSRSMFAGELAKPSSICLGAFDVDGEDGRLCGYLVVSRYVDAWHVMNVATDPDHRGRGIATMLLERLFEVTADDVRRGYTLEVRVSNATAIALHERLGFAALAQQARSVAESLAAQAAAMRADAAAHQRQLIEAREVVELRARVKQLEAELAADRTAVAEIQRHLQAALRALPPNI